jgi:glycosyltransferase involved in cell wall biosynthesis
MKLDSNLPLVSILIPTYNRKDLLKNAIKSALSQNYLKIEIVICDNASTDGTFEYLSQIIDARLKIFHHDQNIGLINNWNACIEKSSGEYILMLSDDDCLSENAINLLVNSMLNKNLTNIQRSVKQNEISFVYGRCEISEEKVEKIYQSKSSPVIENSLDFKVNYLNGRRICLPSATLLRRQDVINVGGYSNYFSAAIDTGVLFKISNIYKYVVYTDKIIARYLMHTDNFTSNAPIGQVYETYNALGYLTYFSKGYLVNNTKSHAKRMMNKNLSMVMSYVFFNRLIQGKISYKKLAVDIIQYKSLFNNIYGFFYLLKNTSKFILTKLIIK